MLKGCVCLFAVQKQHTNLPTQSVFKNYMYKTIKVIDPYAVIFLYRMSKMVTPTPDNLIAANSHT